MKFTVEYGKDVTLVKCADEGTFTVIMRDDQIGDWLSLDTWCDHETLRTDDPKEALQGAIARAQLCTKNTHDPEFYELGDKPGFLYGIH